MKDHLFYLTLEILAIKRHCTVNIAEIILPDSSLGVTNQLCSRNQYTLRKIDPNKLSMIKGVSLHYIL